MRVLVTGGAGFIGTNLIKQLLLDGHKVTSLDNYSTGKKENEVEHKNVQYVDIEMSNQSRLDKKLFWIYEQDEMKPDIIFHLASVARIQPSFEHPKYTFDSNVTTTLNILEYARRFNIPLIYAGSSSSNGDKYANPYTLSKSQGEQLCKLYSKIYNLPTTICRFYNVYGPHQLTEGEYCTLIGIFERLKKENKTLTVTGDGEQRRDFTHVDDIVDGLIRCGRALQIPNEYNVGPDKISGETFELGRGKNYSVNDIVEAFDEDTVEYIPPIPGEMRETLCTDTKAKEMLGWNPTKDVVDYIKENYGLL